MYKEAPITNWRQQQSGWRQHLVNDFPLIFGVLPKADIFENYFNSKSEKNY